MGQFDIAILFLSTQGSLVIGLHGVFKTVQEEAEFQKKETLQEQRLHRVILQHFKSILLQRDFVYPALLITAFAVITWTINVAVILGQIVQIWAFSLALIESLVLFFSIEVLYILSSRWLPKRLRKNQPLGRAVEAAALAGAVVFSLTSAVGCMFSNDLSCFAFGRLGDLVFAAFFIAFFISGLGEMALVDTISETLTSHAPLDQRARVLAVGSLLIFPVLLIVVDRTWQVFGLGTGYVVFGGELATGFAVVYLGYLLLRRKLVEHFTTLVYGVLVITLAGLFFAYSFRDLVPPNLDLAATSVQSPVSLVLPLTLFAIGYLGLSIELPNRAERKWGIRHDRLLAGLTFLLVFAVLANYQRAIFSGLGAGVFFFQKGVPISLGAWAGAVAFSVRKITWARGRGRIDEETINRSCINCGQHLQSTSKFCSNCGAEDSGHEEILFASDAKEVVESKEHHSRRRKIASLLLGGPLGFLYFGVDITRRVGPASQIIVTNNATYFEGRTYLLKRVIDVKRGHYSNSIILTFGNPDRANVQKQLPDASDLHRTIKLELRSSNPTALSRTIKQAARLTSESSTQLTA